MMSPSLAPSVSPSSVAAPSRSLLVAFIAGAVVYGLASLLYLGNAAPDDGAVRGALRLTGRMSALVFLALFVAGPAARVGVPALRRLGPHRGALGLFFAGGQVVHAALIALLLIRHPATTLPLLPLLGGLAGYAAIAAMVVSSLPAIRRFMSEKVASGIHHYGMLYLLVLFAYDLFVAPLATGRLLEASYWPFAALLVAGIALRWLAGARTSGSGSAPDARE